MSDPQFTKTPQPGNKPLQTAAALFDHERLDVYQVELQFIAWTKDLLEELTAGTANKTGEVRDQLDRASLSMLLNTAEGNGKRQRQIRARFFDDARGSGTECAACLDALVAKRAVTGTRVLEGKKMLLRIVSMLCALVERFDSAGQLKDEPLESRAEILVEQRLVNYRIPGPIPRTRTRTRKIK